MSDCLIIGGGVIGMMSARALALSGAKITLIDQRQCGKESSWAGGGILSPLYPWQYDDFTNELSSASQLVYQALCDELKENTGINPEYRRSGLLMMDQFDSKTAIAWMSKHQINYQKHPKGALFERIAQVRNPRLLQALEADIRLKGVKIIENLKVNDILFDDKKALGVDTGQGRYYANNVLLCTGAWSGNISTIRQRIFPIKGQMIVLKVQPGDIEHIILDQGKYVIPRVDGHVLVGSTMEDTEFDKSVDDTTKDSLKTFAVERFSSLSAAPIIHHWSGLRPASESGAPMIEKHHQYEHLFINTGHFRNGINTAPESANKICVAIQGQY